MPAGYTTHKGDPQTDETKCSTCHTASDTAGQTTKPISLSHKVIQPVDTVVLTMTPLPVAYSDTLFIPMYDNPKVALDIYAEWEERADYVLYFSDYYPCLPEDIDCVGKKRELEELLRQHPVVSQTHINGQGYILYNLS
jgi:hypothetical protein